MCAVQVPDCVVVVATVRILKMHGRRAAQARVHEDQTARRLKIVTCPFIHIAINIYL